MTKAEIVAELPRLSPQDRAEILEQLPITDWHRAVLNDDQARYEAYPTEGSTWPEVKARLLRPS